MYKAPYPYQNINNTNLPTSYEREITPPPPPHPPKKGGNSEKERKKKTTENVDGPHLNIEPASKYTKNMYTNFGRKHTLP